MPWMTDVLDGPASHLGLDAGRFILRGSVFTRGQLRVEAKSPGSNMWDGLAGGLILLHGAEVIQPNFMMPRQRSILVRIVLNASYMSLSR